MLSHSVCGKCLKVNKGLPLTFSRTTWSSPKISVFCPDKVSSGIAQVNKPPPTWCPYKLEHAVAQSIGRKKKNYIKERAASDTKRD
jgi:hypothetical protein